MISDLFFSGVGFSICAIIWMVAAALRAAGREDAAASEAERMYDRGQSAAAPASRPAYSDDDYPAEPAIRGAVLEADPPLGAERIHTAPAGGTVPVDTDSGPLELAGVPGQVHALAAITGGETIAEEADRLEARLVILYAQMNAEAQALIADDVARIQLALDAGAWAAVDWLPRRELEPA